MTELQEKIDDLLSGPKSFEAISNLMANQVSKDCATWIFVATKAFLENQFQNNFDETSVSNWEQVLYVGRAPHIKWSPMPDGVKKIQWNITYYEGMIGFTGLAVYPVGAKVEGGEESWAEVVNGSGAREFAGFEAALTDIEYTVGEGDDEDTKYVQYKWLSDEQSLDGLAVRSMAEAYCIDRISGFIDELKKRDRFAEFEFEIVFVRNGQPSLSVEW